MRLLDITLVHVQPGQHIATAGVRVVVDIGGNRQQLGQDCQHGVAVIPMECQAALQHDQFMALVAEQLGSVGLQV
ncbi:hypothetical protein D3C79_972250 [compost metagenome]